MHKLTLCLAIVVAIVAATAGTAGATAPFTGTFDESNSFVDTETCAAWGFDLVGGTEHEYGFIHAFTDNDGNFVKAIAHINYDATISANGKTLVERDTWEITVYPDGTWRFTGSSVHIQGPDGGILIKDAGQVKFNDDGTIAYEHGPHMQLNGASFCPALA
jgi:hypothetical protein